MIERPHGNIVFYDEINNNQKICAEINFPFLIDSSCTHSSFHCDRISLSKNNYDTL